MLNNHVNQGNQEMNNQEPEPDLDKQYDEVYDDNENFNARIVHLENRIHKNVKVTISLFS